MMPTPHARTDVPVGIGLRFHAGGKSSRLAMACASTKAIQELAGHQSLTATQRYMHLSPAAKSTAIELLNQEVLEDIKETAQGSARNP